jgi:hypothetical protein
MSYTSTDQSIREDLLDVLTNLNPTETQLISGLGTSTAKSTRHEWLTDTLGAVKANYYVEGADASYPTLTNPTRLLNYTQIFRQGFLVSDTERAVNTATYNDRFAYEGIKALKMLKNDMEFSAMRGTLACTASNTTAGQMQGIKSWMCITSNHSGVSLSEAIFNDYLQTVWTNGANVDAAYVPMTLKRRISSWTANATKYFNQDDKRLVNSIDVYSSDAAKMVKLFPHRHVTISTDTNNDFVGIQEDLFKIAYLRKPFNRSLAKTGDAEKGEVVAEATLECLHRAAGFYAKNMS